MNPEIDNNRISKRLLTIIAFLFAAAYVLYCIIYWGGEIATGDGVAVLAVYILMPHLIATAVGFVLTTLALFLGKSWWNLAAGIVYIVAIVFFPAYWFFLIVPCVLSFFAFARMRKLQALDDQQVAAKVEAELDAQSVNTPNEEMAELVEKADEANEKAYAVAKKGEADEAAPAADGEVVEAEVVAVSDGDDTVADAVVEEKPE